MKKEKNEIRRLNQKNIRASCRIKQNLFHKSIIGEQKTTAAYMK